MPDNDDIVNDSVLEEASLDAAFEEENRISSLGELPSPRPAPDDRKDEPNYTQWALGGNGRYSPVGTSTPSLPPGIYEPFATPAMWGVERLNVSSDQIYELPDMATNVVLDEADRFWNNEDRYRKHNLLFKRGIILYGPAGSGKTITLKLLMNKLVSREGIVIIVHHVSLATMVLKAIKRIEPKRNLICVFEDIDEIINQNGEAILLSMLDGEHNVDRVLNIATCHSPETRFLTKDLRWKACGDLKVGEELWAFDEQRPIGKGARRAFRPSIVTMSHPSKKECVKLHLSNGETLTCTTDHPLLAHKNYRIKGTPRLDWFTAPDTLGMTLVRPFVPWKEENSWESGWLAGILDGEGSIPSMKFGHRRPSNVCVTQNSGPTADRIREAILARVPAHVYQRSGDHAKQQVIDTIGGLATALQLIGQVRANRLIERVDLTGSQMHNKFPVKVEHVEYLGIQDIQSISTSTGTYIAEGFASHNTNYPERLGARIINRPSRFDRRVKVDMPGSSAREAYIKFTTAETLSATELKQWVSDTEKMSIAHLRELVAAVYCLGQPYPEVIERLKDMAIQVKPDEEFARGKMGFRNKVTGYAETAPQWA